jgi:hypothetical protein
MIKIRHTGIVTNNLKKSLNFWQKNFKFEIKKDVDESGKTLDKVLMFENIKVRTLKLCDSNDNLIELLYFNNPKSTLKKNLKTNSIGITHISVSVKNLKKIYKDLKKKIRFNSKPLLSADGNVLMTYCRTPEGCFLELVEEIK